MGTYWESIGSSKTSPNVPLANGKPTFSSTIVEEASTQATMQHWVEMECNQLSSGSQISNIDILEFNSLRVVKESQFATVHKVGTTPKNFCALSYSTISPDFRFSALKKNTDNTLYFLPENTDYDILVPEGAQTTYVALNQDKLLHDIKILNPEKWSHSNSPSELFAFESKHKHTFKITLDAWLKVVSELDDINALPNSISLDEVLLQGILQVVALTPEDSQPTYTERLNAFQTYRIARNYIEEQLYADNVPTLVSICEFVGVSERTLQYAFRMFMNMAPTVYLRLSRLNRVRSILIKSDPKATTVTHVAMHFGFFHLGRFSINYKNIFGESPSDSLLHRSN